MSGFKAFGLELTFFEERLDQATEKQAQLISHEMNLDLAATKRRIAIKDEEGSLLFKRANRVAPALEGAQILWVDVNPKDIALYKNPAVRGRS
jgi:hypothetical protein